MLSINLLYYIRGRETFSGEGQTINTLQSADHIVFMTTQLCHSITKAAPDNTYINKCGFVKMKLCLQNNKMYKTDLDHGFLVDDTNTISIYLELKIIKYKNIKITCSKNSVIWKYIVYFSQVVLKPKIYLVKGKYEA